jgi:hypothetical protein
LNIDKVSQGAAGHGGGMARGAQVPQRTSGTSQCGFDKRSTEL